MGIDRLVMFLTNNYSIKEVLAFPMMKEEQSKHKDTKLAAELENVKPMPVEGIGKLSPVSKHNCVNNANEKQPTSKCLLSTMSQ